MQNLKPSEIVAALDRYIVGQKKAKRSVAVALRNRWRRQQIKDDLKNEIAPKNIILIGPTGVGKTEIARRLSRLTDSPFYKVEASKFTEVGYVGRDVESMVRDLVELTVNTVKLQEKEAVRDKAENIAEERLLDALLPGSGSQEEAVVLKDNRPAPAGEGGEDRGATREKLRALLRRGKLDERYVDLHLSEKTTPMVEIFSNVGMEEMGINLRDMLGNIMPKSKKRRKMKVKEARRLLTEEEAQNLVDMERVVQSAIDKVEQAGIIFLDEIDKIVAGGGSGGRGPDVSREGVQRDLLPIVEGSTVTTKYGPVKTDHILFVGSGAFHTVKPSDLIPELQGRFPIRVELDALGSEEFYRILTEPRNALLLQYVELLRTESVTIVFEDEAVQDIARIAQEVNERTENIGARRLHTLMEHLLEDILFDAPDMGDRRIAIDAAYVQARLKDIKDDEDLSRYIL